jgi:hypothetical protein
VLLGLGTAKLSVKLDKGAARTVGGSLVAVGGLTAGKHSFVASLLSRLPAGKQGRSVTVHVGVASGGYALVVVWKQGTVLRTATLAVHPS